MDRFEAARTGDRDAVRGLIPLTSDLNGRDNRGQTARIYAAAGDRSWSAPWPRSARLEFVETPRSGPCQGRTGASRMSGELTSWRAACYSIPSLGCKFPSPLAATLPILLRFVGIG